MRMAPSWSVHDRKYRPFRNRPYRSSSSVTQPALTRRHSSRNSFSDITAAASRSCCSVAGHSEATSAISLT
jgi:hypothetical protein